MIKVICDGCGNAKGDMQELGIVRKRHYCPDCADVVLEYLAKRDELHDDLRKRWQKGHEKLEKSYDIPLPA